MSKVRIPIKQAKSLAERIKAALTPACERIEIAGSIRRKKAIFMWIVWKENASYAMEKSYSSSADSAGQLNKG